MNENIIFDDFDTIAPVAPQRERIRMKKKPALFVPSHRLFRNEMIDEVRRSGYIYPMVKMPPQQMRYIKGRDNDCL